MFLRRLFEKPKSVVCASCGEPIQPREGRTVDKNRKTKAERHTHLTCPRPAQPPA